MIHTVRVFIILFVIEAVSLAAVTEKTIINLDCVNYREYSYTNLFQRQSQYQRALTFTLDTSFVLQSERQGVSRLVSLWLDLSSETSEPLFLRFTGGSSPNREHGTHGGAIVRIPKLNLQFAGNYRHLGAYADRLEQYCASYIATHGNALHHQDIGHYGVAEYITGQWKLDFNTTSFKGIFNKYGEWTLIPGLYLPLYRDGNIYIQTFSTPLFSGKFTVSGNIKGEKEFPDHSTTKTYNHYSLNTHYSGSLSENSDFSIQVNSTSEKTSRHHCKISVENTTIPSLALQLSAGLWSGGNPEVQTGVRYELFNQCTISTEYSYKFTSGEKNIRVTTPTGMVTTLFSSMHSNNFSFMARFISRYSRLPISISLWSHLYSNPEGLSIDTTYQVVTAGFIESDQHLSQFGGELKLEIPLNDFLFSIWNRGNYTIIGVPYENLPFEAGVGMSYKFDAPRPIYSKVTVIWRSPYTWNSRFNGSDSSSASPSVLFCDFQLAVPFYLPIFSSNLAPEITISASPIPFFPSKRPRFHPFGTEIGPLITVVLNCDLLKDSTQKGTRHSE